MKNSFSQKFSKHLKTLTSALVISCSMAALTAHAELRPVRDVGRIDLGRTIDPGRFPPIVLRCPVDPAVVSLDFRIASRTSTYRGTVVITGVVRNLGSQAYITGAGQQAVYLYEDRRLVATRPFANLASGAAVSIAYARSWDASSPAEGEFPPTYKAVIGYDPDIYIDGNPQNDDCSQLNNQLSRSGSAINALF